MLVCSEYMKWEVTRLLELPDAQGRGHPQRRRRPGLAGRRRAPSRPPGPGSPATGRWSGSPGGWSTRRACSTWSTRCPQLRDEHPGLRVVIAGDGPYRRRAAGRGAPAQAPARRSASPASSTERELPAVLAATDATVVPSLYEPFGMVALEAAAAGAPLAVAAHRRARRDRRARVTGVTFPHSDPDALAGAVGTLLADAGVRPPGRQGRRGRMVAERYGWADASRRRPQRPTTSATARSP